MRVEQYTLTADENKVSLNIILSRGWSTHFRWRQMKIVLL